MKITTICCDRCGKSFDLNKAKWNGEIKFRKINITEFYQGGNPIVFKKDLCVKCTKELEKFLHGGELKE